MFDISRWVASKILMENQYMFDILRWVASIVSSFNTLFAHHLLILAYTFLPMFLLVVYSKRMYYDYLCYEKRFETVDSIILIMT